MYTVHACITPKVCIPLIFCSLSSVSVSCFSSSAGGVDGMLGHRPKGHSLVSNVLPACIRCPQGLHRQRRTLRVSCLVMTAAHVPKFHSSWEADDSQCDVSISQLQSPHTSVEEGRKQVESFCTLIQMAGCNFKSLIVILWHFTSPPTTSTPPTPSEFLLIWVMLTEMRIGAMWNSDASLDDHS